MEGQIGLEKTPAEYIAKMVAVFREVRRVLRSDGTCWVNMGDCYAGSGRGGNTSDTSGLEGTTESQEQARKARKARGSILPAGIHANAVEAGVVGRAWVPPPAGLKQKDLVGMPWRLAFALQADGWWLRQDIIWSKPNPMPESVLDRCTKAHEYLFLLTKSAKYYYDAEAIKEGLSPMTIERWGSGSKRFEGHNNYFQRRDGGQHVGQLGNTGLPPSGTRNKRSVWEIATEAFPEAHFATFPTKLVEPCILAGTSEKGCCEACGAPWVRMVDVSYDNPGNRTTNGSRSVENRTITAGFEQRLEKRSETTGWKPSCKCSAPTAPCTVLDCFNGSGTTGLVALANRCNYIGIELSPEYAAMSERRLAAATAQGVLV